MPGGDFDNQARTRNEAEALFGGSRRKKPAQEPFIGMQGCAPLVALDAWWRRAQQGAEFVYCEAVDPIRGDETWIRVRELARDGYLRAHERKRAGGGKQFFAVRTTKRLTGDLDPIEAALSDPATDSIFRALKRAANLGLPCPSDAKLAETAGLNTRDRAAWRVRTLIRLGLIGSTQVYDGGVPARVVTIEPTRWAGTSASKFTALPKKWAAAQAAAARDAAEDARRAEL